MKKIFALLLLIPSLLFAEPGDPDKTLSPYFFVKAEAAEGVELLPLKATSAEVKISGVIADVKVTQIYKNEGQIPLEATYVFPGSTNAAVYGVKMTIGERVRIAKIKEKEVAKKIYEQAKAEGKSASLLEQERPNVFKMSVANIMPQDEIKVELQYTELLVPTEGVYEFDYPTVVGPRYSNRPAASAKDSEKWVKNPYLQEGEDPTYSFDIELTVDGAVPIRELFSPSHGIVTDYLGSKKARVKLAAEEANRGNKDFILRYVLSGDALESGLLLTEANGEKFFMLMAQPPKRVRLEAIPSRDYLFILDVSGSMMGFPIEVAKTLMHDLLENLRETDTFNVLLFAGSSELLSETPLPATNANLKLAFDLLERQNGSGGTELLPALKRALAIPKPEGASRSIVIATDGYVDVEKESQELIASSLGKANVFSFGIGSSVNRYLIEALAHAGGGEPFFVTDAREAKKVVPLLKSYIESPVLTNIKVTYEGFDAYDVEPLSLPDLFANRPLVVFGKFYGDPKGQIKISGLSGEGEYRNEISVADSSISEESSALRYLWARKKIQRLSDYGKAAADEDTRGSIVKLGLAYNLLTQYTSFVAVDEIVRNTDKQFASVKQPLPLPEGVHNSAVGDWGQIGTGPEPETWGLIAVMLLSLFAFSRLSFRAEA